MGALWMSYVLLVKKLWVLYAGLLLTGAPTGALFGPGCSAPV